MLYVVGGEGGLLTICLSLFVVFVVLHGVLG